MIKPDKLFHCATPKKAKLYRQTGRIIRPVRGFSTLMAAMAWCIKVQRSVIYEIELVRNDYKLHKMPDHHNQFGSAWWIDGDVEIDDIKCVFSA